MSVFLIPPTRRSISSAQSKQSLHPLHSPRNTVTSCSSLTGLSACSNSLPFCCPTSTSCIPLTPTEASVICCPTGTDCTYIEPITCDISLQNATAYPFNTLHTTQLGATLPTCGSQCCPLGYQCLDGICAMERTSGISTTPAISAGSSSATATGTGITIPTNTAISIILANATTILGDDSKSSNHYPPHAILIGIVAGLATGILLTLLLLYLARRYIPSWNDGTSLLSLRRNKCPTSPLFGGKTPRIVSGPVSTPYFQDNNNSNTTPAPKRTDFLLHLDSQTSSPAPLLRNMATPSSNSASGTTPYTPISQMAPRRASGLPPLFQSPLRFGLPISPMPVPVPPRQPPNTGSGDAALAMGLMGRDGRGFTEDANALSATRAGIGSLHRTCTSSAGRYVPAPTSISRQNSDESYISTGSGSGSVRSHKTSDSTGTIHVLMPPPFMMERSGGGSGSGSGVGGGSRSESGSAGGNAKGKLGGGSVGGGNLSGAWYGTSAVAASSSASTAAARGVSGMTTMGMFMEGTRVGSGGGGGGGGGAGLRLGGDLDSSAARRG